MVVRLLSGDLTPFGVRLMASCGLYVCSQSLWRRRCRR
uniref:Uncharacterized protein n=1 Tax=Arundo donax TaxID=35708 RepID=A0A0A9B4Z1_ARUDO